MPDDSLEIQNESKQCVLTDWSGKDTGWMLSQVGTGIGAGLLYLPISAGSGGIWPLILMSLICGPMILFTHRGLTRFCLSAKNPESSITQTVYEHFGGRTGYWLVIICLLSMFPVLLLYSIGISNLRYQFYRPSTGLSGTLKIFCCFYSCHRNDCSLSGERAVLTSFDQLLVIPLSIILMGLALYLVPQWQFDSLNQPIDPGGFLRRYFWHCQFWCFLFIMLLSAHHLHDLTVTI